MNFGSGYPQQQSGSGYPQQQGGSGGYNPQNMGPNTMELGNDEFIKLEIWPQISPSQMLNIASTFLAFDRDKNGVIKKEEMLDCLRSNGIDANPQQVYDYVNKMDTNHDGQVSWTEYFRFMVDVFQGRAQGIMPR